MSSIFNKKNLQLLYELDLNCKQSNREVAKKLRISKDAVGYRIKQLEQQGIIRGHRAIINTAKLGFTMYRVYLNLINVSKQKLDELIEFLISQKNTWWVAKNDGTWNFVFAMWAKHTDDFYDFYTNELCPKFNEYIKNKLICPITKYILFNRSYFTGVKKSKSYDSISGKPIDDYDSIDIQILKILSINARTPLVDISMKLNLDTTTIRNRIKKLERNQIIVGYRADIDVSKLKKDVYSIGITLNSFSEIKEISGYLPSIPESISTTEVIGGYDAHFDIEVDNSERYFEIIDSLKEKFKTIREINYYRILQNYKIIYLPDI